MNSSIATQKSTLGGAIIWRENSAKKMSTLTCLGRLRPGFSTRFLNKVGRVFAAPSNITVTTNRSYYQYSPEPFHPIPGKDPEWLSAREAVEVITSGKPMYRYSRTYSYNLPIPVHVYRKCIWRVGCLTLEWLIRSYR